MPKVHGYRPLPTTVIGPQGRPLEIQVRTREMHETAEFGVAAHWLYKRGRNQKDAEWVAWVKQLMDEGTTDEADPREFMKTFRTDLFDEEVHVFTPKGQVKTLPAGSTPIDFAYAVHTDVGHHTVGAKVNGRIVPLHYQLKNGDFVEILTAKSGRGPSRDWMSLAKSSRARNKIRQWFSRETRADAEQKGREALEQALRAQKLPYRKLSGSAVLAQVIRGDGFHKADEVYVGLGAELPGEDRDRCLGPPAAPGGRRPDVLGTWREHRRLRRRRRGSAGEELVHGRDRRHRLAARAADGAAQHRGRVRRVSRHPLK